MCQHFPVTQSSSFPVTDYFDISSRKKKKKKSKSIVCKGYKEWTICLFLHIAFKVYQPDNEQRGEKGRKTCKEIGKRIWERSLSPYITLWTNRVTKNTKHQPHCLSPFKRRSRCGQRIATARYPLYIVYRLQAIFSTG